MRKILACAFVLLAAVPALADLDLSALAARVAAQAGSTSGKERTRYAKLQKTLAKSDRTGLADDFGKLQKVAAAVAGPLAGDAELAAALSDALAGGLSAVYGESTNLVQISVALELSKDRNRCTAFQTKGRTLADRATIARTAGKAATCASLAGRAASAYERGVALALSLLAKQDARAPKWSVPLHDLGGALLSVWAGTGPTPSVYAVGADDGTGPLFLRMGGEGWVRVPVASSGTLWWVTKAGDAVFASGTGGRVVRYDPSTGAVADLSTGVPVTLYGTWGASANDVWTVGGNVDGNQPRTALLHHDGVAWTSVDLPAEANNRTLFKIWGQAANDIWACGQAGLLMHYDGASWTVQTSGTFESLFTVHGAAPTISVGGSIQPTIVERTGQSFAEVTVPAGSDTMRGVHVPAKGDPWACGLNSTVLRRTAGRWARVGGLPDASGRDFHAVFVDDAGGVYLAGGNLVQMNKGSLFYFGSRSIPSVVLPQAKLREHVQPRLYANCALTACHIGPFISEDLDLSTAEATVAGDVGIPSKQSPLLRVLPGRPTQSYLLHKILGTHLGVGGSGDRMPAGGPFLSPADVDLVRAWILEGALDD